MIPFATFVQQLRKGCPVCSRTVRHQASAEAYAAALLQTEPDLRQDFATPTALANYLRQEAKSGLDDTEEPRLVLAPLLRNHQAHTHGPLCFVSRATLNRAIQAAAPKPAPKPAAGGDDDEP